MRSRKSLLLTPLAVIILAYATFTFLTPIPKVVLPTLAAADVPSQFVETMTSYTYPRLGGGGRYVNHDLVWRSVDLPSGIAFCTATLIWETPNPVPITLGEPKTENERPSREVAYGVSISGHRPRVDVADYVPAGLTACEFIGNPRLLGAATDARIARITVISSDGAQAETQPKDGVWFVDLPFVRYNTDNVTVTGFDSRGRKLYDFLCRNVTVRP